MAVRMLGQGAFRMPSPTLQIRPKMQVGMMRTLNFTHRVPHRNILQAPFRSTHALSPNRLHPHISPSIFSRLWLLVPLGGGLLLYTRESPPGMLSILSSPSIIPSGTTPQLIRIDSPYEPNASLLAQLQDFVLSRIWEPICTGFRFLHLLGIFLPVVLTAPMILIGPQEERYGGDRWGAVVWYGFLVKAMQRAGPTFIKVCWFFLQSCDLLIRHPAIPMGRLTRRFIPGCPV